MQILITVKRGLVAFQMGKYPDRKYGFIDAIRNWVIRPQFNGTSAFIQGLAAVKLLGLWGYVGSDGEWAIEPAFSRLWQFSDAGHAYVRVPVGSDEKLGMFDIASQWLLPLHLMKPIAVLVWCCPAVRLKEKSSCRLNATPETRCIGYWNAVIKDSLLVWQDCEWRVLLGPDWSA